MRPLIDAWQDFRGAAREFSRPVRFYLLAEFLVWTAQGVFSVLFNLYLVEAGFSERFVGRAIAMNAVGLAVGALPAGLLAERWSRRRCLMIGVALEGIGHALRASTTHAPTLLATGFGIGLGQSLFQIAAAPFLTEHSTPRERTHVFSTFFASALVAGVVGSALGGALPRIARTLVPGLPLFVAYRFSLLVGAGLAVAAALPILAMGSIREVSLAHDQAPVTREDRRRLVPIALNALLIGMGAGLVIPFMNLYFKDRFACSSAQIGMFFSIAQIFTACAALLGPAIARRFGKLRTAVTSELLSLPFLVTLGAERRLAVAAASFWMRSTLMQAATPLLQTFIMEAMPPALRPRATSLINLVWNIGWAVSAVTAGTVIEKLGYAMPFYFTATLYAIAASTFWFAFRRLPEHGAEVRMSEEAKGRRAEGI
ncbi:MAG TPA: MFS transporter [Candidatus Acidoferrales bacterium]|nr:MFS transporter [Candidatus Acidoferrales bacterium]